MNLLKRINNALDLVFTATVIKILFGITILLIPVFLFYGNPLYLLLIWAILEYLDYRKSRHKPITEEKEWKW